MAYKIKILMVEDNPVDADLTREKLDRGKFLHELRVVGDGVQALAFLRREAEYAEAPRPDLILLDLNMPRKDGRELLADLKADPELRRIPVVILTSSEEEADMLKAYDLQASAYVTKPVGIEGFGKIVKAIENFWFAVVTFPPI